MLCTFRGRSGRRYYVEPGRPAAYGAFCTAEGVQFAVVSRHATLITLLVFEKSDDTVPEVEIPLVPEMFRVGDVWHCRVRGCSAGTLYLYRADGPYDPENGARFNRNLGLLDPYAQALTASDRIQYSLGYDPSSPRRDLAPATRSNLGDIPKCIVVDDEFDWEGDRPLKHPLRTSVIYEAHVRGLTMHPSSGAQYPGTFRGVVEMIPYLKRLGITSLELLPVHEFDTFENPRYNPLTGEQLTNYWGYSSIAFFAPKIRYSSDRSPGGAVREFKQMVKELHAADIEVILDVVFNHTGEGDELGPTLSFRGLDNSMYYLLDEDRRYYKNFSGCGNTVNCNAPVLRSLILDCLRYWTVDMHVDGFRFDLASVLGRDQSGNLMENPPILERIAEDPLLRDTKIIAEAWDAGGAYQVGSFPGTRWAEWNDRYRDDVRRYWRGEPTMLGAFATRLTGSADLYHQGGRKPFHSINFVAGHDGFSLNDLVTYSSKHNEANGEGGRDGHNTEYSYNYGVEGRTVVPSIAAVRLRQLRNMLASLMVSLGTPMIRAGDELLHTQCGNNNAYCQDNELSWTNYSDSQEHRDFLRFATELIHFRRRHPSLLRGDFFTGEDTSGNDRLDITWVDSFGHEIDWRLTNGFLGAHIDGSDEAVADPSADDLLFYFNASVIDRDVALPKPGYRWRLAIDTSRAAPHDIYSPGTEPVVDGPTYRVERRSSVVFIDSRE